jgi:hypothetical protein
MSALFVYKQGFEGKYNQSLLSTWQSLEWFKLDYIT